jgi:hypothetical protein
MQKARTDAYDACYYGCNDCDDVDWAYNACQMTARARVTGVICDGNLMWNWAERYPIDCLQAVGEFYKADALRSLKQSYRNQLAVIILTILAGIIGAVVTYKIWGCVVVRSKAQVHTRSSYHQAAVQRSNLLCYSAPMKKNTSRSAGRIALLITAFATLIGRSKAFPCTGYGADADQYFINANKTVYGVVHGWFSDCYYYSCGCRRQYRRQGGGGGSGSGSGPGGGSSSSASNGGGCAPSTCTGYDKSPIDFVNATLKHVKDCGFELADEVDGDVNMRIANSMIEKNWWVKISVNRFNMTNNMTDPSITCLHDFADK